MLFCVLLYFDYMTDENMYSMVKQHRLQGLLESVCSIINLHLELLRGARNNIFNGIDTTYYSNVIFEFRTARSRHE